jgi:hypothetical protein
MVGNVNVDAASPWAKFPGHQVMAALDATNGIPEAVDDDTEAVGRERTDREYEPIPDGPIVNVEDVLLVDIQSDPEYLFIKAEVKAQFMREGRDEPYSEEIAARAALNYKKQNDERFSATYQREAAARQLNARVRKVAGLAVRLSLERGREMSRDLPGDFMKRINRAKLGAFGPVEASTPDELERQNDWVRNLEAALLRGEFPSWL